ncbi:hypothetical protein SVAN01_05925 [Stagonosporopsis vannaccii]|nr:hypothetical protein SVAN01_05925 [Stagonosporopsis vannaccii]
MGGGKRQLESAQKISATWTPISFFVLKIVLCTCVRVRRRSCAVGRALTQAVCVRLKVARQPRGTRRRVQRDLAMNILQSPLRLSFSYTTNILFLSERTLPRTAAVHRPQPGFYH